ncbi:calmodulin-binding protein 60 B-like isoform X1 [Primulina huaijiensis]|uniref:calmodulin-binding protein 60 B-like isoform X1 n=1 Tax=Primulina huaijiensis TaxID=1492673 RepID=UPI003CC78D61
MNAKRLLGEGSEGVTEAGEDKRRRLSSNISRGVTAGRLLQEYVPRLEPLLRTWVREAVESSFKKLSSCQDQIERSSVSKTWQLRFLGNIPSTIFTGSRILSDDKSPVKVVLCDPTSQRVITSGSISSSKVDLVVLDGGFDPDDHDNWMGQQFDRKTVQNREGKRPLVTGELIVQLCEGVGHIGDVSFTDNSSWVRSGKFRLGAILHARSDQISVREGISNAFKVKDHRGESYQKLYPPSLDDDVWRLEKIAKDGPSHKKLMECEIHSVKDFLRLYFKDQLHLRHLLHNISNKMWKTIVEHALTCPVDNKLYLYSNAQGTSLVFNSVHKVVGATFDGQNYHSLDKLDIYHGGVVESLKQQAYDNLKDWVLVADPSIIGCPIRMLLTSARESSFNNPSLDHTNLEDEHDYLETQMNVNHPTISFSHPYKGEEQYNSSLEMCMASSSDQNQGTFNLTLGNSFEIDDSPAEFFVENDHIWASEENYAGSQLLHQDLPVDGKPSAWQGRGLFLGSNNQNICTIYSSSGIHSPKTRWCKVLAVIKWWILVRRNIAARKLESFYNLM